MKKLLAALFAAGVVLAPVPVGGTDGTECRRRCNPCEHVQEDDWCQPCAVEGARHHDYDCGDYRCECDPPTTTVPPTTAPSTTVPAPTVVVVERPAPAVPVRAMPRSTG